MWRAWLGVRSCAKISHSLLEKLKLSLEFIEREVQVSFS